jgi:hypothetical protein
MRKSLLATLAVACPLVSCGRPADHVPQSAVDASCGLDCASQQRYGLIVQRCFEYANPSVAPDELAIGAWVRPPQRLEGGRLVLPVLYSEGGLIRMTDLFFFEGGDLYLARRSFQSGQSVTYRDEAANIVGVPWWQVGAAANRSFQKQVQADVWDGSTRTRQATTFRVNTLEPTDQERTVPAGTFGAALKIVITETPEHGMDTRRVFAEGTGFTLFASPLHLAGETSTEYRLLRIRDVGAQDGGSHPCGVIP